MASKNLTTIDRLRKILADVGINPLTASACKELAIKVADRVKKRTRLGYGVSDSGERIKLDSLSPRYIETREDYSENLSAATRARRSNLTATGQMLDAIEGKGAPSKVIIEIAGRRTGELTGGRSRATNAEVARYVQEQGRTFFALTTSEKKAFAREVKQLILETVRKRL